MKKTILLFLLIANAVLLHAQTLPYTCNFDSPASQEGWVYYQGGDAGSSDWNMSGGGLSAPNALTHGYNVGAASTDTVIC